MAVEPLCIEVYRWYVIEVTYFNRKPISFLDDTTPAAYPTIRRYVARDEQGLHTTGLDKAEHFKEDQLEDTVKELMSTVQPEDLPFVGISFVEVS